MKQSTLRTCYHSLVNALEETENRLKELDSDDLLFDSPEQKKEVKDYLESKIDEINEAIAEVEPELKRPID